VFEPTGAWLDDEGGVLFSDSSMPPRVAALHDHDLEVFADHASLDGGENGVFHWRPGLDLPVTAITRSEVERRFGFVASPAKKAGD
jgi:Protein of unknown function (DUF2946)